MYLVVGRLGFKLQKAEVAKNKRPKNLKKNPEDKKNYSPFSDQIRSRIFSVLFLAFSLILILSFFEKAGIGGEFLLRFFGFLIGKTTLLIPFVFLFLALLFLKKEYRKIYFLGAALFILGIAGFLSFFNQEAQLGGSLGYLIAWPVSSLFGFWVSQIIFSALILIGILILFQSFLIRREKETEIKKPSFIKKIFAPRFKVKEIPPATKEKEISPEEEKSPPVVPFELKRISIEKEQKASYLLPPLNLLNADSGTPTSGDIKNNLAIIKKTLQNFGIPVEMSEVHVGPTVTQYTLKPAEGVKLSKIVNLGNDLALSLASHPIRIEAPIPGKALVGVEVPNKVRAQVRMRNLIAHPDFQNSVSNLTFALGRDVAGRMVFADLARMPHLLVAGSTGTGKTICLNSLIISLLYQNSSETLKFILIDPKRVEFPVYNPLPHLLTPVIFDVNNTVLVLKWLINEMERRFEVFSAKNTRDIISYNQVVKEEGSPLLPYIVLIIDELADLMAAKGREIEAEIVRLAQMARAVGIHLVVATQRPSVEVVTGLIKANITSRIAFQVASQVDSRTVLDMAGAEKLLGLGDLLYTSAETAKPKRVQAAYISEKEVKKVVNDLKSKGLETQKIEFDELEKSVEKSFKEELEFFGTEDPLYETAKRVVREAKKASASLLQRRLRIGYARAARLIDILEDRGVVGPGEGAKPREVYIESEEE